jgi:hypothetical protein
VCSLATASESVQSHKNTYDVGAYSSQEIGSTFPMASPFPTMELDADFGMESTLGWQLSLRKL